MVKEYVLVVEDEEDILEFVTYNLKREGYSAKGVSTGEEALEVLVNDQPDLVLLDIMLPGMDGFDVCRAMKKDARTSKIPVILLTARTEDADVVAGLELGADDYVAKPFSLRVLFARIKKVLRKSDPVDSDEREIITAGPIKIDMGRHEAKVDGKVMDLTSTEFKLLRLLAGKPGRVFSRTVIIEEIKGEDYPVTDRSVDVQVVGLRKKLGDAGKLIETVRGVGYKFREDD